MSARKEVREREKRDARTEDCAKGEIESAKGRSAKRREHKVRERAQKKEESAKGYSGRREVRESER